MVYFKKNASEFLRVIFFACRKGAVLDNVFSEHHLLFFEAIGS